MMSLQTQIESLATRIATEFKTAYSAIGTKQNALGFTPENAGNKVTVLSSSSTDSQYPSAKCVYDALGDIETILTSI